MEKTLIEKLAPGSLAAEQARRIRMKSESRKLAKLLTNYIYDIPSKDAQDNTSDKKQNVGVDKTKELEEKTPEIPSLMQPESKTPLEPKQSVKKPEIEKLQKQLNIVNSKIEKIQEKKSKKDPLVTSISPGKVVPVKQNDTASDLVAKIYNLLKKSYDERKLEDDLKKDFEEERQMEAERRHKEFIKKLTALQGGTPGVFAEAGNKGGSGLGGVIGGAIGSLIASYLAKKLGRKVAEKILGKKITEKVFGKVAEKSAVKAGTKEVSKEALKKSIVKKVASSGIKAMLKSTPFLGFALGAIYAAGRASEGDKVGAAMELTSGATSMVPVAGTVASLAIDSANIVRDIYKENYGIYPEDDKTGAREARLKEITDLVKEEFKKLAPAESKTETPQYDAMGNATGFVPETQTESSSAASTPVSTGTVGKATKLEAETARSDFSKTDPRRLDLRPSTSVDSVKAIPTPPEPSKTSAMAQNAIRQNNDIKLDEQVALAAPIVVNNTNNSKNLSGSSSPTPVSISIRPDEDVLNYVIGRTVRTV